MLELLILNYGPRLCPCFDGIFEMIKSLETMVLKFSKFGWLLLKVPKCLQETVMVSSFKEGKHSTVSSSHYPNIHIGCLCKAMEHNLIQQIGYGKCPIVENQNHILLLGDTCCKFFGVKSELVLLYFHERTKKIYFVY